MRKTMLALCLIVAGSVNALAQTEVAPPVLVVTGTAEVRVTPDQATVRLGVVRQSPNAQAAQEQVNETVQEMLKGMAKMGVASQRIQTSRLTLNPVYAPRRPDSNDAPRIVAYTASNLITVTLEDMKQIGPVIDAGLDAGANEMQGVQFEVKNDLPVRQQALQLAVRDARAKAETMAEALGVRLAGVLEVSEGGSSVVPYGESDNFLALRAAKTATPVSPGELQVQASVAIRYRIDEKR